LSEKDLKNLKRIKEPKKGNNQKDIFDFIF